MIIKATRLQALGGARVGRSPPLENKKKFGLYWEPFCYFFFFKWGHFFYAFSFLGAFSPCGGLFPTFTLWWGPFFGLAPPPTHTKIAAGAHDCKEGSRALSPEIFLCDRNLVSSGHVL